MKIATVQILVRGDDENAVMRHLTDTMDELLDRSVVIVDYRISGSSGEMYVSDVPQAITNALSSGQYQPGQAFPDAHLRLPPGRDYVMTDSLWLTVNKPADSGEPRGAAMSVSVVATEGGVDIATYNCGEEMESPRRECVVAWTSEG